MKRFLGLVALFVGAVMCASAQVNDTIQRVAGNDLYQGITRKLPYRQMVTPHGVQVTFAKTVHIIFPSVVRYVDLGSNWIIAGKADGAENVIRVKATTEGFPGETNFSVICEDGSFYSFNARYAHEPEMLNIEMKDFLENEDTTDFSHTRMNIHFRELAGESPLLVKLIMQSIYKEDRREIRHLGCKRFGGAVPPEIRPLAQRAVLFPHGNEEQVERGFPDTLAANFRSTSCSPGMTHTK